MGLRGRVVAGVSAVGAAVVLSGCYGSTEPATDVAIRSATLHGKGTTNNGPAQVYFKLWPTQFPGSAFSTLGKQIPGGLTGPYSEAVGAAPLELQPDTDYTFQLCGQDQGANQAVCAQTRTFRTLRPSGDYVNGGIGESGGGRFVSGTVDARSDPNGAHPGGTLSLPPGQFTGTVTCLRVQGNRAVVGGVGIDRAGSPATAIFVIQDGGAGTGSAGDGFKFGENAGSTPPDCASETFTGLTSGNNSTEISSVAVYDAP